MSTKTFFQVARRPKWIGGLLIALAVAAIFALLAQWQIDRTYRYVPKAPISQTAVPLESIAKPSSAVTSKQADRLVTVNATPGPAFLIRNRVQLTGNGNHETGTWTVRWYTTDQGKWILVATDWSKKPALPNDLEAQVIQSVTGIYEPSEDPLPGSGKIFDSLSAAQLVNQPGLPENMDAYAGFLILQQNPKTPGQIVIGTNPGQSVFNWLTAFYALEWTVFAGFAIFLWGRVVQDEVNRLTAKGRID